MFNVVTGAFENLHNIFSTASFFITCRRKREADLIFLNTGFSQDAVVLRDDPLSVLLMLFSVWIYYVRAIP
jgi:hypothetical protein